MEKASLLAESMEGGGGGASSEEEATCGEKIFIIAGILHYRPPCIVSYYFTLTDPCVFISNPALMLSIFYSSLY